MFSWNILVKAGMFYFYRERINFRGKRANMRYVKPPVLFFAIIFSFTCRSQNIDTSNMLNAIKKYIGRDQKTRAVSFSVSCPDNHTVTPYLDRANLQPFFTDEAIDIPLSNFKNCNNCIRLDDYILKNNYILPGSRVTIVLYPIVGYSAIARVISTNSLLITTSDGCWFQGRNEFYVFRFNANGRIKKKKRYVIHVEY